MWHRAGQNSTPPAGTHGGDWRARHSGRLGAKRRLLTSFGLALAGALLVATAWADAPPGPFFQGFETDTAGWFDASNGGSGVIMRQPSGYAIAGGYASGIASSTAAYHARVSGVPCTVPAPCVGPNTRWGGYSDSFPIGGYRTEIDIYLDVGWAASHLDARFDFSSAINDTAGTHRRDLVFNAGTNRVVDPGPAGFFVNASTNAFRASSFPQNPCPSPSTLPNLCRTPVHITSSGWYTFRHTFRDDGGFLAVDMEILNAGGGTVALWTIYTGDAIAIVGGNRYGWFANEEIAELAIDDSSRTGLEIGLTPASETNIVGTDHTVTATVTSTDPNGHPTAGAGIAVEFDVVSGPNAGQTSHPVNTGTCSPSNCATDSAGQVSWTYTSNGVTGTDTIQACFPERSVAVQRPGDDARHCRTVTKTWGASPGKVTGGGQLEGDPVFSVAGVLLSAPALVPNLSDPESSPSDFGFVVNDDGVIRGNLQYHDHSADVRIKAQTMDALLIGSGVCGPMSHATFTGSAEVTRSTGTTTETFTVEVDDCGSPGSDDTFGISTTTYSSGPSTLVGGNISIH